MEPLACEASSTGFSGSGISSPRRSPRTSSMEPFNPFLVLGAILGFLGAACRSFTALSSSSEFCPHQVHPPFATPLERSQRRSSLFTRCWPVLFLECQVYLGLGTKATRNACVSLSLQWQLRRPTGPNAFWLITDTRRLWSSPTHSVPASQAAGIFQERFVKAEGLQGNVASTGPVGQVRARHFLNPEPAQTRAFPGSLVRDTLRAQSVAPAPPAGPDPSAAFDPRARRSPLRAVRSQARPRGPGLARAADAGRTRPARLSQASGSRTRDRAVAGGL